MFFFAAVWLHKDVLRKERLVAQEKEWIYSLLDAHPLPS